MVSDSGVVEMITMVAGAGGLVGSALNQCANVIGLTRDQLDITDTVAFRSAVLKYKPMAIINAAAQAGVDRSDQEPDWTWSVNADAPPKMAQIAKENGVRFVHLSTDYVLDASDRDKLDETVDPNPRSTYASSKLAGEAGVLEAGGVVVRLQWVYQPGNRGFFNHALGMMGRGEAVRLVTDQVGCPTPAGLLAPALMKIVDHEAVGLFHLATRGEATAFEWLEAAANAAGVAFTGIPVLRRDFSGAHRPARSVLDSSKVEDVFGIRLPEWRTALQTVMNSSDRMTEGGSS